MADLLDELHVIWIEGHIDRVGVRVIEGLASRLGESSNILNEDVDGEVGPLRLMPQEMRLHHGSLTFISRTT